MDLGCKPAPLRFPSQGWEGLKPDATVGELNPTVASVKEHPDLKVRPPGKRRQLETANL